MMEKLGVKASDLRASRELELKQILARVEEINLKHEKTASENGELNELTSRAEALEAALRAEE